MCSLTMPSLQKWPHTGWEWGGDILWCPDTRKGDVEAWCGTKGWASDSVPYLTSSRALSPILHTQPGQYLQEDWQTLYHPWFKLKVAYMNTNQTILDLKFCDPLPMDHLGYLVPIEAGKEGKGDFSVGKISRVGFTCWVVPSRPWILPVFGKTHGNTVISWNFSLFPLQGQLQCPSLV